MWNMVFLASMIAIAVGLSVPVGGAMARLLAPKPTPDRFDRGLAKLLGPGVLRDQSWMRYAGSMLLFNVFMFTWTFAVLSMQGVLPFNPDGREGLEATLAFNTAISFVTNTNLQHYAGERSLGYFAQILALGWLQFVSAATGIAALAAIARSLGPAGVVGNFYRDVARVTFGLLVPLSLGCALLLMIDGVPMTLGGPAVVRTLEGATQTIARGPVAAMVAIKQLGSNGGGYFGPNGTHPFENPTMLTDVVENVAILLVPMACVWMFGSLVGHAKHALVVFGAMLVLLLGMGSAAVALEAAPNPGLAEVGIAQPEGNLEGKELRLGWASGPVWAATTTATSNGSVSAMHDSLNPLTGLVPLVGMWLNVTFGGCGVGMINMLLYIVIAVFIAGLMVGRTPEYLGRKVEAAEMQLASLALLLHPLLILGGTALFVSTIHGRETISNPGSHGFSQILYEFSSAAANNGSGFEGLGDNTPAWNIATGLVMFVARFLPIVLPLGIAASLASKRKVAVTSGTLRTDTPLFGFLLLAIVGLLGALLFLPTAVLGPVAEHLALQATRG